MTETYIRHIDIIQRMQQVLNVNLSEDQADQATQILVKYWIDSSSISLDNSTSSNIHNSGLILSPQAAGNCALAYRRTRRYLRALYKAINDLTKQKKEQPIQILYPGCGPFGILVLPLLPLFSPSTIQVSILDFNIKSINIVKQLISYFQLEDYITECITIDALQYQITAKQQPDVIISEILQAGLKQEGHVAINRHLITQTPNATLIPQQIALHLKSADPSIEFSPTNNQQRRSHRADLGCVFTMNRQLLLAHPENGSSLPGTRITLPKELNMYHHLFLFTEISLYGGEHITEYEDGLTTPIVFNLNTGYVPGKDIYFTYDVGQSPELKSHYIE
ncbi:hypothetical protein [Oceanospirillum beijerinckii]|uniref:hypothetical protein n=1 Tax=Oceanospirillum beijerinckii TaxID=64976 RepID=UPI0004222B4E|nr:hypothetical protein [Oceanospirillum beijerinckii]